MRSPAKLASCLRVGIGKERIGSKGEDNNIKKKPTQQNKQKTSVNVRS